MANPQAENGHLDIAHEIVEALARIRISGEEYQCLWVILRKTYGWHKKEDRISLSQFTEMTGINRFNVHRAIDRLLSKKIISVIKKDNDNLNSYCFNKDFEKWEPLSKKITVLSKKIQGVIKKDKRVLSKKIHTKETITKETITKEKNLSALKPETLAAVWNELKPTTLPKVVLPLNNTRKRKAVLAIKTRPDQNFWKNLIGSMSDTPFLLGGNNRGWKADFDFILDKYDKVFEGKYKSETRISPTTIKNMQVMKEWVEEKQNDQE